MNIAAKIAGNTGGGGSDTKGDVVGPASATNNNLAAFDGTTGKLLKDSGIATSSVALITQSITNGDTTHAPSGDAVFDALAAVGGITNSASVNTVTKSDGTNLVDSDIQNPAGEVLILDGTGVSVDFNGTAGTITLGSMNGISLTGSIVSLPGLQTSNPAVAGQLWNNLGVVMVSAG